MKYFVVLALLAVAVSSAEVPVVTEAVKELFAEFKKTYGKSYRTPAEEAERLLIFAINHDFINTQNLQAAVNGYTLAMNKYGDLKNDEFLNLMTGYQQPQQKGLFDSFLGGLFGGGGSSSSSDNLPTSVDWGQSGHVTPVKDQGRCGGCWAFSAIGALEGLMKNKTGSLTALSEQELIDCSTSYGTNGCSGGNMEKAFSYAKDKGSVSMSSYPYISGADGTDTQGCKAQAADAYKFVTGFKSLPSGDEKALKAAVAERPVSIAFNAGQPSFQFYSSGVYYDALCSAKTLNHGLVVVGYGTTSNKQDYWIVKNSWGASWGDNGYFLAARNKNNNCGVAAAASYPL